MTTLLLLTILLLPNIASAVTCAPDEYQNADNCYSCPANATCDGVVFTCDNGFYKNGALCTKCPVENSTCTGPDDFSCNPDTYLLNGQCAACPANATCAGGTETFHCDDGWYKFRDTCLSCAGHVCDGETLISCREGWFYSAKRCLRCSVTYGYCPAGAKEPRCIEGYYAIEDGKCQVCPSQYYCPLGESTRYNVYQYCAPGYYRAGNDCAKCPDGVECPGKKPETMTCSDGLYLHDNGQCLPYAPGDCGVVPNCNPGCFNNGTSCEQCAVANSTCTGTDDFTCNAGYYQTGNECTICPEYASCDNGTILCEPGYYLKNGVCTACTNGPYYCNNNIRHDCPEYVDGSLDDLLPDGAAVTKIRKVPSWPPSVGAVDVRTCRIYVYFSTPQGDGLGLSFWWNGERYYQSSSVFYWLSANVGYYLGNQVTAHGLLLYTSVQPCTNGADNSYYTGPGSPDSNDCPWICNDGYYRVGDTCQPCPPGQNCAGGGIVCPLGSYADGAACVSCPAGYGDNPNRGAQTINDCQIKCVGGTYLSTPNGTECVNVGAGNWLSENLTNYGAVGIPNQCVGGMTTAGYGASADELGDCGRKLYVGDIVLYLRSDKKTTPSLNVQCGDQVYYGSMRLDDGGHGIKIKQGDTIYTVVDETSE